MAETDVADVSGHVGRDPNTFSLAGLGDDVGLMLVRRGIKNGARWSGRCNCELACSAATNGG